MKLTQLTSAILAGGLLLGAASVKADDAATGPFTTSGSVAFTSDYLYRGVSQTGNAPAVQGSLAVSHESGFYAAVWASSINFAGSLEIDPSVGYSFSSGDVTYDMGVLYYGYPQSTAIDGGVDADFVELYGSVAFGGAKFGLAYSPDFTYETDESLYLNAGYGTELSGVGLSAYVGYNTGDAIETLFGVDDYVDYKLAASKEIGGVGFELALIGTDLDDVDEEIVLTVSKGF